MNRAAVRPVALAAIVFTASVALHVDRLPLWCVAIALGCALWCWLAAHRSMRLPVRTVRVAITCVLVAAVLGTFRTLNGLAAGTALLVVMGAVKLLETRARRDQLIVIFASLFLLLAACLDRQHLTRAPLYAAHAWLACTALLYVAHPSSTLRWRESAGLTARSLALATPLALMLFVFFPRIPGAFWALPKSGQAVTGLSNSMSPGSITELTDSDAPAFRVWFDDAPPPPHERYWRGPVLHEFDGYTWRRVPRQFARQPRIEYEGAPVRYRVALEPHSNNWWFALDMPAGSPDRGVIFAWDYQLLALEPVTQVRHYAHVSHTRTRALDPLSTLGRRIDSALPAARNVRTQRLAARMRAAAAGDAAFASDVLEMFRTGGFEYTLTPPRLDLDSVDDFLFNTRRGFCGHFASAYVTLMRAAGVPARVVTGYLGGEWNPIGGYFIVRQSDAHAWAEVWLEGRGWTRIDPTGVVAPERLTRGLFDLLPDAASARMRFVRDTPWLARSLLAWDALNAWWNDRVVGFDFRAQLGILERLGLDAPGWQQLGIALAVALGAWLAWIAMQLSRSPRAPPPDRLARAYARLCRKLARVGLRREPHEGPTAFAARIEAEQEEIAPAAAPLLARYAQLRFGVPAPDRSRDAVAAFARDVSAFRPPRSVFRPEKNAKLHARGDPLTGGR
ncbi:MAG: transglutaminase TgpA family protein [Gammaproteobacteria bacterium]